MIEIYAPWARGLAQDKEALALLHKSTLIDGIELGNINDDIELIMDSGLKVSAHTPGLHKTLNFAKQNYVDAFEDKEGHRILDVIHHSNAPIVGFHLGYSAEQVYKMNAFPNIPHLNSLILDKDVLIDRLVKNIRAMERKINDNVPTENQKNILLETLDYSREVSIGWNEQSYEAKMNKTEIEKVITKFGVNASLMNLTDPPFVKKILDEVNKDSVLPVGFLFDIAHNYISADAKIYSGIFDGSKKDYFLEMQKAINKRTLQIHINVPGGDSENGFTDSHLPFDLKDKLSLEILDLARLIFENSPNLLILTLEIRTPFDAVKHAEKMIEQAAIVIDYLNINR